MSNNIYPDLTNSRHDVQYAQAKILKSDIIMVVQQVITGGKVVPIEIKEESGGLVEGIGINNIDGGFAAAKYLFDQNIDGGFAGAGFLPSQTISGGDRYGL